MSNVSASSLIDRGLAAHHQGDVTGALSNFNAALEISPNDPEALHLAGLMHEILGDQASAIRLIQRAVEIDPRAPLFRMNLAGLMLQQRRLNEAAMHVDVALEERPNGADVWTLKGQVELGAGAWDEARAAFDRALEIDRTHLKALAGFGETALASGHFEEAAQISNDALQQSGDNIEVIRLAMLIADHVKDDVAFKELAGRWQTVSTGDLLSLQRLGAFLSTLGYKDKAHEIYSKIIQSHPEDQRFLREFAFLSMSMMKFEEAVIGFRRLLTLNENSVDAIFGVAQIHYYRGNKSAAETWTARALTIDPDCADALCLRAELLKARLEEKYIFKANRLFNDGSLSAEKYYKLKFALGSVYHDLDDYLAAERCWNEGNAIGKTMATGDFRPFHKASVIENVNDLKSRFAAPQSPGFYSISPYIPIFIVGMPRSGATLLESMLHAHPEVTSIGESSAMPSLLQKIRLWMKTNNKKSLRESSQKDREAWRNFYFDNAPAISTCKFQIDKQPNNIESLALINLLMPEAKILHIRRNPVDCGFSIYRLPFSADWPYAFDLNHIALAYGAYARLTAHWEKIIPDEYHFVQYEDFIEAPGEKMRAIVEYIGLDWHDSFLTPNQKGHRGVTFGDAQAYEPIRPGTDDIRDQYPALTQSLIDALQRHGVDLRSGALAKG